MQHNQPGIYAIYDRVACTWAGPLQTWRADAVAIRVLGDIARDQRTEVAKHPNDYDLYYLGSLADAGINAETPRIIINAGALLAAAGGIDDAT